MGRAARIGLLIAAAGAPAIAEGVSPYVLHGLRSAKTPDWFLGMFFGIVGLICFYELVVFAGYRRREQLLFVASLLSTASLLAILEGLGLRLLWPGAYALDQAAYCLSFTLAFVFGLAFPVEALGVKKLSRPLYLCCLGIFAAEALFLAANLAFLGYPAVSNALTGSIVLIGTLNTLAFAWMLFLLFRARRKYASWYAAGLVLIVLGTWIQSTDLGILLPRALRDYGIYLGTLGFILSNLIVLRGKLADQETERRAQREGLMQADKLAGLGILASTIVHDLANPNAAIANDAAALERSLPLIRQELEDVPAAEAERGAREARLDRAEAAIRGIGASSKRIGAILETLRAYYRPDKAAPKAELDLGDVAEASCRLMETEALRRRVALAFKRPGIALPVSGYAVRLEQALVNLLLNALQAAAGRPEARVELDLASREGRAVARVVDNGPGMADIEIKEAGSLFRTSKGEAGSGLGLYIVRRIAEEHGGELRIESPAFAGMEGGVCAQLSLPLAAEEERHG